MAKVTSLLVLTTSALGFSFEEPDRYEIIVCESHIYASSPLLCGCYVIECIIFQIKPCNLCPAGIKYR